MAVFCLLLCHSPAQIYLDQLHTPLPGTAVELWEHLGCQQHALLVEVAEGAREEHPDFAGFGCFRQEVSHGWYSATA